MNRYPDPLSAQPILVNTGPYSLELRDYGDSAAELVILLHGFPECWASWRHQIMPLVRAGYRVLVPNLRGYGLGDKPQALQDYRVDQLAGDIDALMAYAKAEHCHLVGHDWGGGIAWWYGIHHSQRLLSLSILNAPHPLAFLEVLKKRPQQWLKSWYIFFFQLPWLPERVIRLFNFKRLRDTLIQTSTPGAYTDQDLQLLQHTWQQPGTVKAMLNYYRCLLRDIRKPALPARVSAPTQILWGEQDLALSLDMAVLSREYLDKGELIRFADATHWLAHDKPDAVSDYLLAHFARHSSTPGTKQAPPQIQPPSTSSQINSSSISNDSPATVSHEIQPQ